MSVLSEFLAQMDATTLVPQLGFGGILVWVIVSWLKRVESKLDSLTHSIQSLAKAVWLDLAERATPGSFVREEAKRMVERDRDKSGD